VAKRFQENHKKSTTKLPELRSISVLPETPGCILGSNALGILHRQLPPAGAQAATLSFMLIVHGTILGNT
jgi:hypothetical protein